ncbi:hypothetical protein FRX31_011326 [Thalictrum thalictroides]|uniref:Uncharacterized protein n=1 Tax=Thalictrum thalictroides TaxID=46969 RepID=A0A7J6WNX9_THATH|nr:hypothetical protein FRX31_011326 [Thalictrum thalictroides]
MQKERLVEVREGFVAIVVKSFGNLAIKEKTAEKCCIYLQHFERGREDCGCCNAAIQSFFLNPGDPAQIVQNTCIDMRRTIENAGAD